MTVAAAVTDDADARAAREAMVARLEGEGALSDPEWARVLRAVPRHRFVPAFFQPIGDGSYRVLSYRDDREAWLREAYADEPLVTQLDGRLSPEDAERADARPHGAATCSSSQPSLMALMLDRLELRDGMTVLELGTGTGYNAALLSERLGDGAVTSIDIDPVLVDSARVRLAGAGYAPVLAVADGAGGYPARAPYDRLIATCGFPAVAPAWLEQVVAGGLILVNLYTPLPAGALVALIVGDDRAAAGAFTGDWAGFMPTRVHHDPDALRLLEGVDQDSLPAARPTAVTGGDFGRDGLRLLIALTVPARLITVCSQAEGEETWLLSGDGSYARQTIGPDGVSMVAEGGKRSLWSEVEAARRTWTELGGPGRDLFTLTVDRTGRHTLGCRGTAWSSTLPDPSA